MTVDASPRVFAHAGLTARVVPFAVTGALALLAAIPAVTDDSRGWLALAAIIAAMTLVVAFIVPWPRLPAFLEIIPPAMYIAAVAALRHAAGGPASGYSAVYLVPVLWFALYGTRTQLVISLGLVSLALAVPIVLVGDPLYPVSEWRRLLILVGVGATLGPIVQTLVGEVRASSAQSLLAAREIAAQQAVTSAMVDAASDAVVSFDWAGTIVAANPQAATMFQCAGLVGQDVFEVLVPEDQRDRLRAGMGRIILADVPDAADTRFEADLVRANGDRVPVEIAVARTDGADGMRIHAFVRDLSVRREAERAARDHRTDLDRLLSAAEEIGRTSTEGRSAICAAAREFADADFALLYTMDATRGRLIVTGSAGRSDLPIDIELDPDRSVAGGVLRSGQAMFIGDLDADPRIDKSITARVGAAAAFMLPISVDDRPVGVLVTYWREPHAALSERVLTMFRLFATQAALAVERAELLARLELLARTDALTGAANRRTLDEVLERAVADAGRSGRPVSIVMLDLDHFKRYNDTHGHLAGDELLRGAVAAWQAELRPTDTLARFGGEEFLVVLPATDPAAAIVVSERLRAAMPGLVTASAGTATWDGIETRPALIARADAALYEAKAGGRARTVASAPAISDA